MRELVNSCDRLMEDLKCRVHRLRGVYERSDAMLANYAGGEYEGWRLGMSNKVTAKL